jgi:two-component system phosphate regulon response regulator OmpR
MDRKGRLLVVDDDRAIRKLLERIARRAGFEADSAKDGAEALEMLDGAEYDVALIDLMMPRVSGYELVQRISARERRPIIIVATALTNTEIASVDDTLVRHVIRKPFDVHAVIAALNEAVSEMHAKATFKAADPAAEKEGEEPGADPLNSPRLPC